MDVDQCCRQAEDYQRRPAEPCSSWGLHAAAGMRGIWMLLGGQKVLRSQPCSTVSPSSASVIAVLLEQASASGLQSLAAQHGEDPVQQAWQAAPGLGPAFSLLCRCRSSDCCPSLSRGLVAAGARQFTQVTWGLGPAIHACGPVQQEMHVGLSQQRCIWAQPSDRCTWRQ